MSIPNRGFHGTLLEQVCKSDAERLKEEGCAVH